MTARAASSGWRGEYLEASEFPRLHEEIRDRLDDICRVIVADFWPLEAVGMRGGDGTVGVHMLCERGSAVTYDFPWSPLLGRAEQLSRLPKVLEEVKRGEGFLAEAVRAGRPRQCEECSC